MMDGSDSPIAYINRVGENPNPIFFPTFSLLLISFCRTRGREEEARTAMACGPQASLARPRWAQWLA